MAWALTSGSKHWLHTITVVKQLSISLEVVQTTPLCILGIMFVPYPTPLQLDDTLFSHLLSRLTANGSKGNSFSEEFCPATTRPPFYWKANNLYIIDLSLNNFWYFLYLIN
jgi:hypothetical protein